MIKVVKIPLIYADLDENSLDYKAVYEILWSLQRQTRAVKNKAIQLMWEYSNFSSDYKKRYLEYPNEKETIGKSLRGYVYSRISEIMEVDLYSKNLSASTTKAYQEFNHAKTDMLRGTSSVITYKSDQPLDLVKNAISVIKTEAEDKDYYFQLKLFNSKAKVKYGTKTTYLTFKALLKDRSSRAIVERCFFGEYAIAGSMLIYNRKKGLWCLNLTYEIPSSLSETKRFYLEKDKILGVFLDFTHPVCASVYGDSRKFIIDGNEIESFRKKTEQRRISLLRQAKYCGDGRIGHGIKTRNRPAYKIEDKIARFRNTVNHKYARAVVEYAVKNQCSIIQLEDLTGVSNDDKFLKNWSYYDFQSKLQQKATEYGITVRYVKPHYIAMRCSKCGFIDKSRQIEETFVCLKCGYEVNTYFNASQNMAIDKIDEIIKKSLQD